jgi:hypothetical protein
MGVARRAAPIAVVAFLAGCGSQAAPPRESSPAASPVTTGHFVASPTLGEGGAQPLFAIPDLGHFRALCTSPGHARISYTVARGSASQQVTVDSRAAEFRDPGERVRVDIGRRSEWQVARLSKGRIEVATATFTTGALSGRHGCFVSAKADVAQRRR